MTVNLGGLTHLAAALDTADIASGVMRRALHNILVRMADIDSHITCSKYGAATDRNDRPPNGEDFNELWDALLDEISNAVPWDTPVSS